MDSLHEKRMKEINKEQDKLRRNEFIFVMVSALCMGYTMNSLLLKLFNYMGW